MQYIIRAKDAANTIIAQADATEVVFLEGGWYFAAHSLNMRYLRVSDREYFCPYKGMAHWVDLVLPDLQARSMGWVYQEPMHRFESIAGRIAFFGRETSATLAEQIDSSDGGAS